MQNSMVVFPFSVLDQKNPSSANPKNPKLFVQNKLPRLIRIRKIQRGCPFYLFWSRNTLFGLPFLRKVSPKNQNSQFELKIGTKLIRI